MILHGSVPLTNKIQYQLLKKRNTIYEDKRKASAAIPWGILRRQLGPDFALEAAYGLYLFIPEAIF